jgi:hypothetical protein
LKGKNKNHKSKKQTDYRETETSHSKENSSCHDFAPSVKAAACCAWGSFSQKSADSHRIPSSSSIPAPTPAPTHHLSPPFLSSSSSNQKKKKKPNKTHQASLCCLSIIWDFWSDSQRLDSEKAKRKRRLENDSSFGSCGVTTFFFLQYSGKDGWDYI